MTKPLPGCRNCPLAWLCHGPGTAAQFCRPLPRNATLFQRHEPADRLYVVLGGALRLYRDDTLDFVLPGEVLGLEAADGGVFPWDAVALEPVRVCTVPASLLLQRLETDPMAGLRVTRLLSGAIANFRDWSLLRSGRGAEARIAGFLVMLARRQSPRHPEPDRLHLAMGRELLGQGLNLTGETVSRSLHRLEQQGLLHIQRRNLRVLNWTALRRLAPLGPSPTRNG